MIFNHLEQLRNFSYEDPYVEFQMASYIVGNYQQQVNEKNGFRVVVPILFCHHSKRFQYCNMESNQV